MNYNKGDIEQSINYLLNLSTIKISTSIISNNEALLVEIIDAIINGVESKLINDSIYSKIISLPLSDQAALKNKLISELEFHKEIKQAFIIEERSLLKKKLLQIEDEQFEKSVTQSFKIEKRKELKEKLKTLTKEKPPVNFYWYFKVASVAAILIVILLIWQPNKISNQKLFADYKSGAVETPKIDFGILTDRRPLSNVRGDEFLFKNFTNDESEKLLVAIELFNNRSFLEARKVFYDLKVSKESNPELLIYLSISQLNTNETDSAILNLEFLRSKTDYPFHDEVKFHLAMGYLKINKRHEAKILLSSLIENHSIYSNESNFIIKKIRWF